MQYWNQQSECMSQEEKRIVQSRGLIDTVKRVYDNVPFYQAKMHELGVEPGDIKSIEDITKLPFTYKEDLRDNYPYGLFATPMNEIVRIHASSGTTGKQTVVGYTRKDLDTWSEVMARALVSAGMTKDSFIQVSYGYGLFTGGLGIHDGAEKVGASVIPSSAGNTKRQVQIIKDFGTTMLACTPSYALFIAEVMEELGISKDEIKLKSGIFGAEQWTNAMRDEIEKRLGILALDIYGLSEIIGPGVSCECSYKTGLHIADDHFYPEIVEPITNEVLPIGEKGELVFTTITKEGLPLLRYRTRDLSVLNDEVCACGRTNVRMNKVMGRTDDMLIIRGVNVFPSQVESVLLEFGETAPHYQLVVDRIANRDTLEVLVEMTDVFFSDQIKDILNKEKMIMQEIEGVLGVATKVRLVEPKSIERSEGKAKRVIDKRIY